MKTRTNTEILETLPIYQAEVFTGIGPWAIMVTCPREDCQGIFIVSISRWYKPRRYTSLSGKEYLITGRSCPYCFRAARLPERSAIG